MSTQLEWVSNFEPGGDPPTVSARHGPLGVIGFKLIRQTLLGISESLPAVATKEAVAFREQHGPCGIIDKILLVIEKRSAEVQAALGAR